MSFNPKLATFSFFIFLSGAILSILTIDAQKKLSSSCVNSSVNNGLNLLLMLSVMMTCIPILQLICYSSCTCDAGHLPYKPIIIAISVLMIIGTSMVINGLNKDKTTCTDKGTKGYAVGILSFSVILLIVMGFTYTPQWKKFFSKSSDLSADQSPEDSSAGSVDESSVGSSGESNDTPKMPKVKMDFSY